jgi:hypothetical protein
MSGDKIRYGVGARYPLDKVKELVGDAHIGGKPRADVRNELGCGDQQALAFIRRKLREMTPECFKERKVYQGGIHQDVYRVSESDSETTIWYVKISIAKTDGREQLVINSFHIAEHEM